jgi:Rod binding domain-containing protein
MNIPAFTSALKATGIPAEDLPGNNSMTEKEKVHELCRQFEAVLLRQILGDAQKQVIHSALTPKSATREMYQDMATGQLAEVISQSGSLGFGRSLEAELLRQTRHVPPKEHP